jgi:septal ring factor EnvC (AmiA/AmiB activator)
MLVHAYDPLLAVKQKDAKNIVAMPDFFAMSDPARSHLADLATSVKEASDSTQKVAELEKKLTERETAHDELLKQFNALSDRLDQIAAPATTTTTKAGKKKTDNPEGGTEGGGNQ